MDMMTPVGKIIGALASLGFVRVLSEMASSDWAPILKVVDSFGTIGVLVLVLVWTQRDRQRLIESLREERERRDEITEERIAEYKDFVRSQTSSMEENTRALKSLADSQKQSCKFNVQGD